MRLWKQLIYGTFYLGLLAAFSLLIYQIFFRPPASCFDNSQNQKETGIDCGGPCIPCEIARLSPPRINWIQVLPIGANRILVVAEIINPNSDFGAAVLPYELNIYGPFGVKLQTLNGNTFVYAGEIKYWTETVQFDPGDVSRAELIFGAPEWRHRSSFQRPAVEIRGLTTKISGQSVRVSGTLANNQPLFLSPIKVIGVFFDETGGLLGASQTVIGSLDGFRETGFQLSLPVEQPSRLVPERTKIFIEAKL